MTKEVLNAYGLQDDASIIQVGHGLINNTWKIEDKKGNFVLQKINTAIFKHPEFISSNIEVISNYLALHFPHYFFCTPIKTVEDKYLFYAADGNCYRLYPFVNNSHTVNVANNTNETFEAARKFGELTKLLCGFNVSKLKITLPDFHNISLRYKDFKQAVATGNKERIKQAASLIAFLNSQQHIVAEYEKLKSSGALKYRVTHHDTKINNVLFNDDHKGICVIDLDTLMPGYFISDVGDMIRTYTSPFGEEEKDFSKLIMREAYFTAIAEGYLGHMQSELNEEELRHFVFAGKFMMYMQALRFLTDYFNNDIYYGSNYEEQNFVRAGNQAHLLQLFIDNEEKFQAIVAEISTKHNKHLQAVPNNYS